MSFVRCNKELRMSHKLRRDDKNDPKTKLIPNRKFEIKEK